MKTKIVEYIANDALSAVREAEVEAVNLRDKNPLVFADRSAGAGLDYAVMREKLKRASDLLELLL